MLEYLCPQTSLPVRTDIDTSEDVLRRLGTFQLSLWCPHCQTGHKIIASQITFLDNKTTGKPDNPVMARPER